MDDFELTVIAGKVAAAVADARVMCPLAGSITNNVTIDFVANTQLAVGGSAAMVYMEDEGVTLANVSQAMYINAGTQIPALAASIPATAARCAEVSIPWVLDPVGIGIGSQRTQILQDIKQYKPTITRGNASEIIALANLWGLDMQTDSEGEGPRGVDTINVVEEAFAAAHAIAEFTDGAVVISGDRDLVVDSTRAVWSEGGNVYMSQVTGFGCSLGGVCAVYAAVAEPFVAALAATAIYNAAGTLAATQAAGPASFKVAFIDALANLTPEDVAENTMYPM